MNFITTVRTGQRRIRKGALVTVVNPLVSKLFFMRVTGTGDFRGVIGSSDSKWD